MKSFSSHNLPEKISGRSLRIVHDSRRQRLSFQILPATVLLQVPQNCSKGKLLKLITYAEQNLQHRAANIDDLKRYQAYRQAQLFPFEGIFYPLKKSNDKKVQLIDKTFYSPDQKEIKSWYFEQAQEKLQQRSLYFSGKMGLELPPLEIKGYRGRWGACYAQSQRPYLIRYNWQLVQTPPEILDYVVVHELCHLLFFNHSADFKRMLASFYPSYIQAEKWLESHGAQLLLDNPFRNNPP